MMKEQEAISYLESLERGQYVTVNIPMTGIEVSPSTLTLENVKDNNAVIQEEVIRKPAKVCNCVLLNLRNRMSTDADVVDVLKEGCDLTVIERENDSDNEFVEVEVPSKNNLPFASVVTRCLFIGISPRNL